jgi:cell division protein FtsL
MEKGEREEKGYVEGNTVRYLQTMPAEEESYESRREEERRRREAERKRRKKQQELDKFYRMDRLSFAFLFLGMALTMILSVGIVSSYASVTRMKKTIASKEVELSELQKQNDSDLAEINASIDLTQIYKIATKKLGMVHASENQVIEYDSTKSDYVRQYGSIRKDDSNAD